MLIRQLACATLVFGSLVVAFPSESDGRSYRRSLPESGPVRRGYSEYGSHVYKRSPPGGVIVSTRRYKRSDPFQLKDHVVIEHLQEGETSVGGIVLLGTAKENPQQGIDRTAGEGRHLDPNVEVKVGDLLVHSKPKGKP